MQFFSPNYNADKMAILLENENHNAELRFVNWKYAPSIHNNVVYNDTILYIDDINLQSMAGFQQQSDLFEIAFSGFYSANTHKLAYLTKNYEPTAPYFWYNFNCMSAQQSNIRLINNIGDGSHGLDSKDLICETATTYCFTPYNISITDVVPAVKCLE